MFIAALFPVAERQEQPKCLSRNFSVQAVLGLSASTARTLFDPSLSAVIIYYCGFKMYNCILVFKIMTYINVSTLWQLLILSFLLTLNNQAVKMSFVPELSLYFLE